MGSIKSQQKNHGRGCAEYYGWSLSDIDIVAVLIEDRSRIQESYLAVKFENINPFKSNRNPRNGRTNYSIIS